MNTEHVQTYKPTFEEFLGGESIVRVTPDERNKKMTITLKNDEESGLQFVHIFVNRHEQSKPYVGNLDEIRQYYEQGILGIETEENSDQS